MDFSSSPAADNSMLRDWYNLILNDCLFIRQACKARSLRYFDGVRECNRIWNLDI
jgi:hypothetical protein